MEKYEELSNLMEEAIIVADEGKIKNLIIEAMEAFIKGNEITQEDLSSLGIMYVTIPIHNKKVDEIKFQDKKLKYVLEELSAIEEENGLRAAKLVKRFILYLQGKDYDKI
jgi:hypothetical protein